MGAKRWQLEAKDKEIATLRLQLAEAMRVICNYIDYFKNVGQQGKGLERAKQRIESLGNGKEEREKDNSN